MLRIFARIYAKLAYRWKSETEAHQADLNAALSTRLSAEKRAVVEKMNKEADASDNEAAEIEKRIEEFAVMLEAGYWECENGHENKEPKYSTAFSGIELTPPYCPDCDKPVKFIKRSEMTGQEQYESDQSRKETEGIAVKKRDEARAKRAQASSESDNADQSEATAKMFRTQASNGRMLASKISKL